MDRVVPSYTPTIRALRYARQHSRTPVAAAQSLIVAMPDTPGDPGPLPNTAEEVDRIYGKLPHPVLLSQASTTSHLATAMPTKASVLAHLPDAAVAHFACHSASDPADPSQSMLLLADHATDPLTVASLGPMKLDAAQLAYLSACRTAFTGALQLLDEAIHLTTAFQLAGFPHVIGTLWEIRDSFAVKLADAFYAAMPAENGVLDTSRSALALHHAIRTARDELHASPVLWAAYLHAGA
jgi:CHAT domain-containing protein